MSKISELEDGGSIQASDYLIVVRSGGNLKVRMNQITVDQVNLGDNEFIRLGNSQDLTLVHDASNSIINQAGIGDLLIQKAGSTKLTVNSTGIDVTGTVTTTGNVGIGTTTITSGFKMEVIGDARFGDAVGDDAVELGWSGGGSEGFIQAYDRGASAFRPLNINNSLKVDTNGNVGIGTSSPSSIANYVVLETQGDTTTTGGIYYSSSSDSSQKAHFYIGGGTGYLGTQTNHPLAFTTNNTERMRLDASGHAIIPAGVTLGTAVGTYNAANTLDDYEEGSFTPVFSYSGGTSVSIAVSAATGTYVKVGRLVTVTFNLNVTPSYSSAPTYWIIQGFPFSVNSGLGSVLGYNNNTATGLIGRTENGGNNALFYATLASGTAINTFWTISYETDS